MIWYVVTFLAGMAFMWKCGYWILNRAFGKGHFLRESLQNLNADSFLRVHKAVDEEAARRRSLS